MIELTEKATAELRRLLTSQSHPDWGVRMGVKPGGCSGLEYTMALEEKPTDSDQVFEQDGIKIYIDLKSYLYMMGMELDFSTDLVGGGFKFRNPNVAEACGCGESIKFKDMPAG